ncbi:MAG: 3-isopropylmalate dehydratase small subunit [Bacteroidales bacterium]|nr:3-isopropylmalate dehydratase small subunit [Bacteroidales bacterium]
MPFEPINTITSPVALLQADNIDTDRIIPARFLKSVDSSGFGKNLFYDWRYRPDGTPDPEFALNKPNGQSRILLTGKNFGCGSSREHAAWALYQYGFRVIISSGFADIFHNNVLNNGLLPVEVSEEQLAQITDFCQLNPDAHLTVDLDNQVVSLPKSAVNIPFDINPFRKECLLSGSDLIDYLAGLKSKIVEYESNH